jgi:hypothetical protein
MEIDTATLNDYITTYEPEIISLTEKIKDDKTSCQWLVPDEVLNN